MEQTEINTRKNKYREIAVIGIPAVLESLVAVVITVIDTKMISVLGAQALSAVAFTTQPKLIFFSVFYALGTTASVFAAQSVGRGDTEKANAFFHSIIRITVIFALVAGIGAGIFARPIMLLCNRQPDTVGMSVDFFRVVMVFVIFQAVSIVLNAALRGTGNTKVTLLSSIAMGAVDIVFNYLLIEGHFGFPRLEVVGDAIATVAGTVAACGISLYFLQCRSDFLSLKGILSARRDPVILKEIRDKAVSIVGENLFTRIGFLLSSIILSGLSSADTAVYSVTMSLLNVSFAFGDGLQAAAVALIGRSMGAGLFDEIRDYIRKCLTAGAAVSALLSAGYILFARSYFSQFFRDAKSIEQGVQYSYVAAVLTFLQILRIINVGSMRGMGEVKKPEIMAIFCVFLINPGVSFLLTQIFSYGVWGIWAASLTSQAVWFVMSCVFERQCLKKICLSAP